MFDPTEEYNFINGLHSNNISYGKEAITKFGTSKTAYSYTADNSADLGTIAADIHVGLSPESDNASLLTVGENVQYDTDTWADGDSAYRYISSSTDTNTEAQCDLYTAISKNPSGIRAYGGLYVSGDSNDASLLASVENGISVVTLGADFVNFKNGASITLPKDASNPMEAVTLQQLEGTSLPTYSSNATALADGLSIGDRYWRTSGELARVV